MKVKGDWKCAITNNGVQCVMMALEWLMVELLVGN